MACTAHFPSESDLLGKLQEEEEAAPVNTTEPRVHRERETLMENIVYARPRSSTISQIRVSIVFHSRSIEYLH